MELAKRMAMGWRLWREMLQYLRPFVRVYWGMRRGGMAGRIELDVMSAIVSQFLHEAAARRYLLNSAYSRGHPPASAVELQPVLAGLLTRLRERYTVPTWTAFLLAPSAELDGRTPYYWVACEQEIERLFAVLTRFEDVTPRELGASGPVPPVPTAYAGASVN